MEPVRLLRSSALRRRPRTAAEFRLHGIEVWAEIYHLSWVNEQAARAEQIVLRAQIERATRALDIACNREPAPPAISDAQFDNALARLANLRMQQALIPIVLSELAHETWGEDSPLRDVYKMYAGQVDECWLELRRLQRELPDAYVARTASRRARSGERTANRLTRRSEERRGGREESVAGRTPPVDSRSVRQADHPTKKVKLEPTPEPVAIAGPVAANPAQQIHRSRRAEVRTRPPRPSRSSPHLRVKQFKPRKIPHQAGPGGACLRIAA